jgi:hypothetical protein
LTDGGRLVTKHPTKPFGELLRSRRLSRKCRRSADDVRRAAVALEEEPDLRKQIELKKGQTRSGELADIKRLLQASARAAAPAAPDVRNLVLDVGSNPFRGEATAKLTLVEFTDYQ